MSKSGIFLSGWEYNRVLGDSPLESRASALPAECLWNGSAQFWLFKAVYCTKEALETEITCYDALGWTTGRIFNDLRRREFLNVVDLPKLAASSPELAENLRAAHGFLKATYTRARLLSLLRDAEDDELEMTKLRLLNPVLQHLNCVQNISPNSIRVWSTRRSRPNSNMPSSELLRLIADPIVQRSKKSHLGLPLCEIPGTGVSKDAINAQKHVEETIQRPLIPALLAGELSHKDYVEELRPTAHVYKPINDQLWRDYERNIGNLERVRERAEKYLWKDLHRDWLPRLENEPGFVHEFDQLVHVAVAQAKLEPYLSQVTKWTIKSIAGAAGVTVGWAVTSATKNAYAGWAAGATAEEFVRNRMEIARSETKGKTEQLTLFYQSLFRDRREV